jgi:hypothetical protein
LQAVLPVCGGVPQSNAVPLVKHDTMQGEGSSTTSYALEINHVVVKGQVSVSSMSCEVYSHVIAGMRSVA